MIAFIIKTAVGLFLGLAVLSCNLSSDGGVEEDRNPSLESIQLLKSESGRDENPQVAADDLNELVSGNTSFACELYNVIKKDGQNLFFSPYSISIALAMTYAGARSSTAVEMEQALHFTLEQEGLHPAFNKLDLELESRGENAQGKDGQPFRLNINNALWGEQTYHFEQDFIDVLGVNYGAGMNLVDFIDAPDSSRILINLWVENKTEEKIKDLLAPGSISSLTRLVLTNTIYFNAAWASQFEEEATTQGPFFLVDGSSVNVPLMNQTEYFPYLEDDMMQAVELLYDGNEISMVIILPKAGQFDAVESWLSAEGIGGVTGGLQSRNLNLTMPRFKYESEAVSLKLSLMSMGMEVPFSAGEADFSGMDGTHNLFISDVVHKAFVDVDESGTEAAAATAVIIGLTSVPETPVECRIDRPFIFLIRDRATGAVLFMGRICDPLK
jgi:serpin B